MLTLEKQQAGTSLLYRPSAAGMMWLAIGMLALLILAVAGIERTQEARVLETARESLGGGWHAWMLPHANGEIRLQKPPLPYWAAAISYQIFGVSEWAGRVPTAMVSLATIALIYAAGASAFGPRAGFFAGAALAGSQLFQRYSALAETDVWEMLFVTAANLALWKAADAPSPNAPDTAAPRGAWLPQWAWFQLASVAAALAILGKGPPAGCILLFFIVLAWQRRRWSLLWRWVRCGAPLTLLALAAPWFIYVVTYVDSAVLLREIRITVEGTDHGGWFFRYIPYFLLGVMPWAVLVLMAMVDAFFQSKADPRVRTVAWMLACVFVPLLLVGNKQPHYLLPVLPPTMLLLGWWIDWVLRAASEEAGDRPSQSIRNLRVGFRLTLIGVLLAGAGVIVASAVLLKAVRAGDVALGLSLSLAAALMLAQTKKRFEAVLAGFAIASTVAVPLLQGVWVQSLRPVNMRMHCAELRSMLGDSRPLYTFDCPADLSICFYLQRTIPRIDAEQQLGEAAAKHPDLVVMLSDRASHPRPVIPRQFVKHLEFVYDSQYYVFCVLNPTAKPTLAPENDPS